jgi:small subunit ribosomal protein S2
METKSDITLNSTNPLIDELFSVGAHIGYSRSRRHPSLKNFIFGKKNKLDIIDLEKTSVQLADALLFIKALKAQGKTILFVGTKPEARESIKAAATSVGMPYVIERWIGGLLTNFPQMKKRLDRLAELTLLVKDEGFNVYTKKEQNVLKKELEDLNRKFGGFRDITRIPDALFIIDPKHEHIAVREAKDVKIPVAAVLNSDCSSVGVLYPVVANDSAPKTISYFTSKIAEAYEG